MKYMTRRIFDYLEPIMPDAKKDWLLDMQAETLHIQNPFKRAWFVLGCLQVALGLILYDRFGVKRVGQILLGIAGYILQPCRVRFYQRASWARDGNTRICLALRLWNCRRVEFVEPLLDETVFMFGNCQLVICLALYDLYRHHGA